MTLFGKLLVFLNLVFSVVTGALIVFVFTTRANWVVAYNDDNAKVKTAESAYKAEKNAHDNDLRQKDAESAGYKEQVKQLTTAVETAQQEARSARELATKNEGLNAGANAQSITDRDKLNREIIGTKDPFVKGLRQLINEQKAIEDQAYNEDTYITDAVTNREAEFGLLKKRRDALVAREAELKKQPR